MRPLPPVSPQKRGCKASCSAQPPDFSRQCEIREALCRRRPPSPLPTEIKYKTKKAPEELPLSHFFAQPQHPLRTPGLWSPSPQRSAPQKELSPPSGPTVSPPLNFFPALALPHRQTAPSERQAGALKPPEKRCCPPPPSAADSRGGTRAARPTFPEAPRSAAQCRASPPLPSPPAPHSRKAQLRAPMQRGAILCNAPPAPPSIAPPRPPGTNRRPRERQAGSERERGGRARAPGPARPSPAPPPPALGGACPLPPGPPPSSLCTRYNEICKVFSVSAPFSSGLGGEEGGRGKGGHPPPGGPRGAPQKSPKNP